MSIPNTRILFSIKHGRLKNIFTSFTSRFPIKLQLQDFFKKDREYTDKEIEREEPEKRWP